MENLVILLAVILTSFLCWPIFILIWRFLAIRYKWADTKHIRNLSCKRFGWHGPTTTLRINSGFDGGSKEVRCEWCGYEGFL